MTKETALAKLERAHLTDLDDERAKQRAQKFYLALNGLGYLKYLDLFDALHRGGADIGQFTPSLLDQLTQEHRQLWQLLNSCTNDLDLSRQQRKLLWQLTRPEPEEAVAEREARFWAEAFNWERASEILGVSVEEAKTRFPDLAHQQAKLDAEIALLNAIGQKLCSKSKKLIIEEKPKSEDEPPAHLRGTKYAQDRRRWPR